MNIDYEIVFQYFGYVLCIAASIYSLTSGNKLLSILFLVVFLMQVSALYYVQYIGHPQTTSACWASAKSYYQCLPWGYKIAVHIGQASNYLLALVVILACKNGGASHVRHP